MKYYLTTPLFYANASPHIGHAYTTIAADAIKRFRQTLGDEAYLVTGTDEHGQHVERAARAAALTPKEFVDRISETFRSQWDDLGITYDAFVRTTDDKHRHTVEWLFDLCRKNGYIYKGQYSGEYCVNCELYISEAKSRDGRCSNCGRQTELVEEENYFFRLTAFGEPLLRFYNENPGFIQPESQRNEVIAFVRAGLKDLSITRTSITWGIPVPGDTRHVFYVWFDALAAYLTGVGYGDSKEIAQAKALWPADLHLVGKEILRFHAVFWPAFLWAAGLPIPQHVYAHGWLLIGTEKMSKSLGNAVQPSSITRVLGVDGLRYYLLREGTFGADGRFSYEGLIERYNSDLANGVGNLVSRTLTMVDRYCAARIPSSTSGGDVGLGHFALEVAITTRDSLEHLDFSKALKSIWSLVATSDRFITNHQPWALAASDEPESNDDLNRVLYSAVEALRFIAILLYPMLPTAAGEIWSQLGMSDPIGTFRLGTLAWSQLRSGQKIGDIRPLFKRMNGTEAIQSMKKGAAPGH